MEFKINDIMVEYLGPNSGEWVGIIIKAHPKVAPLPLAVRWLDPHHGHTNTLTRRIAAAARIYCPAEELL